jgi:hypothetical protein
VIWCEGAAGARSWRIRTPRGSRLMGITVNGILAGDENKNLKMSNDCADITCVMIITQVIPFTGRGWSGREKYSLKETPVDFCFQMKCEFYNCCLVFDGKTEGAAERKVSRGGRLDAFETNAAVPPDPVLRRPGNAAEASSGRCGGAGALAAQADAAPPKPSLVRERVRGREAAGSFSCGRRAAC